MDEPLFSSLAEGVRQHKWRPRSRARRKVPNTEIGGPRRSITQFRDGEKLPGVDRPQRLDRFQEARLEVRMLRS